MTELEAISVRDGVSPHVLTAHVPVARDTSWVATLDMEWHAENGTSAAMRGGGGRAVVPDLCDLDVTSGGAGLVSSINLVVDEFLAAHDLRPVRVAVIGGPGSGRSFWAQRIAARFYLPLVSVRDLIGGAKQSGADLQLDKSGSGSKPIPLRNRIACPSPF